KSVERRRRVVRCPFIVLGVEPARHAGANAEFAILNIHFRKDIPTVRDQPAVKVAIPVVQIDGAKILRSGVDELAVPRRCPEHGGELERGVPIHRESPLALSRLLISIGWGGLCCLTFILDLGRRRFLVGVVGLLRYSVLRNRDKQYNSDTKEQRNELGSQALGILYFVHIKSPPFTRAFCWIRWASATVAHYNSKLLIVFSRGLVSIAPIHSQCTRWGPAPNGSRSEEMPRKI